GILRRRLVERLPLVPLGAGDPLGHGATLRARWERRSPIIPVRDPSGKGPALVPPPTPANNVGWEVPMLERLSPAAREVLRLSGSPGVADSRLLLSWLTWAKHAGVGRVCRALGVEQQQVADAMLQSYVDSPTPGVSAERVLERAVAEADALG